MGVQPGGNTIVRFSLTLLAAVAIAAPAMAAPGDMSVATFLAKADALKAKGAMAMFASDYTLLQSEGAAAGKAYRSRLAAERTAGKPSSCPPANVKVNSDQLISHFRTYPTARRESITLKTAVADYFIKTWPCKK
jgi:hypothetical protein